MDNGTGRPAFTPYDGSAKPFTIGVSPLDPERWIEPDADLAFFLSEKRRLGAECRDTIFRAEDGSEDAQREALALLCGWLTEKRPDLWRRQGDIVEVAGHRVDLADETQPPLYRAGLLVQDDLVLMRRGETGWRIAAAHVAFPSSWSLKEKFGLPMDEIHASVPGFEGGTRNAMLINRMFDNFRPDMPVKRFNWSVNWSFDLHQPKTRPYAADPVARGVRPEDSFIRVERQTLRKLPVSGDLIFTIRIHLDPLAVLMKQPDRARLAASLADQLEGLTPAQTDYKGLSEKRAALVALLRKTARESEPA